MGLQEKLKGAEDLHAVVAMAREAGFDVIKDDWLRHQSTYELGDDEVEDLLGGNGHQLTNAGCTWAWGGVGCK